MTITRSSCSGLLCALFFLYLFCCQTAACKGVFFFFFPFFNVLAVCFLLWLVLSWLLCLFSWPSLQPPHSLHSHCFCLALHWFSLFYLCSLLLIYKPHSPLIPSHSFFLFSSRNTTLFASLLVSKRLGKPNQVVVKSPSGMQCL